MKSKNLYLHFLSLQEDLELQTQPHMDLECRKILENIAWRFQAGQALTVTKVMELNHIASAATIHRKLDQLRALGLIQNIYVGNNRRTKFMAPTKLSSAYFERVGKLMNKTAKLLEQKPKMA
jgi:Fe2+ or Zn2+ uptake regulation protein